MAVKIKPSSEIILKLGFDPGGPAQRYFTNTCRRRMDKYLPFDTGTLATTYDEQPTYIVYQQEYAEVVYYGVRNGKDINYHKDKHQLAGPYWDKRMVSAEGKDIVKEMQILYGGK